MPRDTRTNAEKLRAHREAFELGLRLGVTPARAQEIINQRAAQERHAASTQRLAAKMNGPLPRALTDPEPPRPAWWRGLD